MPTNANFLFDFYLIYKKIKDCCRKLSSIDKNLIAETIIEHNSDLTKVDIPKFDQLDTEFAGDFFKHKLKYAIAALNDKLIFSSVTQIGYADMVSNNLSLEVKLFQSANAGMQIFEDIHSIQSHKNPNLIKLMLCVYLVLLNSGFEPVDNKFDSNTIKNNLYKSIYGINMDNADLFQCKTSIYNYQTNLYSIDYLRWIIIIGTLIYIIVSSIVWYNNTYELNIEADRILKSQSNA